MSEDGGSGTSGHVRGQHGGGGVPTSRANGVTRDVSAVIGVSIAASLPVYLVGMLAVQLHHALHFGPTAQGGAISLYYAAAAVGSVPFSRLVERVGGARVLRVATLCAASNLFLLAVAANSWLEIALLLFAAGLVNAAIRVASTQFLARRTRSTQLGLAFGIKQSAAPAAVVLGGLAVPALALTLGWRWAFGFASFGALAASLFVPRPRVTLAERRSRPSTPLPPSARPPLVILAAGLGFGVFASAGLSAFIVAYAVALGVTKADAGWMAAMGAVLAILVRVISGWHADHRSRQHLLVAATMLATGCVGYALLASASLKDAVGLVLIGILLSYGAGWGWNGLFQVAIVRAHSDSPARATAITAVGGRLAGALGPYCFGLVATRGSYADAWLMNAVAVLLAAGFLLLGRRLLNFPAHLASGEP